MISRRTFLEMTALASVQVPRSSSPTLELQREGQFLRPRITNRGRSPLVVNDVVVYDHASAFADDSALYGEGFQMLSQTAGTIAAPVDLSQYTDARHYRLTSSEAARTFYGLTTVSSRAGDTVVLAFTSCARFSGRFELAASKVRAIVDCEGLTLAPGESWTLEEMMVASGRDRSALLGAVAERLAKNHPTPRLSRPPTGWCSWYCFGPNVTGTQVLDNLDTIARNFPALKYIQIDDGYQRAMGDWLETGSAFGGSVRTVLTEIKKRGFEPAIWVAPFIAEADSLVFQQHPDWFIKDASGAPLRSDRVTFGGWRHGPWYALDGTHPAAAAHLERVFRTMRDEWGCTYFKLDANFWGAMPGGRFHDPAATRITAYRRGMQAILRGARNGFVLGCNHPIWPSIGLIHGSRSSNDIKRTWDRIASTARQNLSRNWQNGRLWWNDPDAVVLAGELSDAECRFHATAIYASGGMVLSGDDLTAIPPARAALLRKLLPPTGAAAVFDDATLRVGTIRTADTYALCLFNWEDTPQSLAVRLPQPSTVTDYWTDEILGRREGTMMVSMAPRSARLLKLT
jgi:alpha-galactosidase